MAENIAIAPITVEHGAKVDLDLRDQETLLAGDRAEYDIEGVRALLAAINLQPAGGPVDSDDRDAEVVDLAIFRATGSLSLARIFGPTD